MSGRRGPWPLTEKRALYRRLMEQGIGDSEACRIVGINRRTGTGGVMAVSTPTGPACNGSTRRSLDRPSNTLDWQAPAARLASLIHPPRRDNR
jgi:hypothetical protein